MKLIQTSKIVTNLTLTPQYQRWIQKLSSKNSGMSEIIMMISARLGYIGFNISKIDLISAEQDVDDRRMVQTFLTRIVPVTELISFRMFVIPSADLLLRESVCRYFVGFD